jgi:hypothetical protein
MKAIFGTMRACRAAHVGLVCALVLPCAGLSAPAHAQRVVGGFDAGVSNPPFRSEAIAYQAALDEARRTCNRVAYSDAMLKLQRLYERAQRRAELTRQAEARLCVEQEQTIGEVLDQLGQDFRFLYLGGPRPVPPPLYTPACNAARLAATNARFDVSSLQRVLIYEQARGFDCPLSTSPAVSDGQRQVRPGGPSVSVFLEGGASFGHSTLAVDPGAFVPVNETLGSVQGFAGVGFEARTLNLLNRNIAAQLASFPLGGSTGGFTFRLYDDGDRRNVDAPPVAGEVRHAANWSATGYIGFPQAIQQPTGLPFQTLIVTPTVGVTYQEDKVKSVQTLGGTTNTFEKTFGRTGATVGLNFEVPAGNFNYGLITGLTMLPSTTVNGTSSLGLPAQAKIDSQANFFVGGRVGVNLTDFQAPRTYRVGPGFRF